MAGTLCPAQGRTYLCKRLDLGARVATVRPADLKYYTKTRDFTDVYVIGGRKAYASHAVRPFPPRMHPCPMRSTPLVAGRA